MSWTQRTHLLLALLIALPFVASAQWDDEDWDAVAKNCKRPPQIQDPAGAPGALINQIPFVVSVAMMNS